MSGEYYVYVHRKKTDGSIFYVGQGKGNRWKSYKRSKFWHSVQQKYGFTAHKIVEGVPQQCALSIERAVIAKLGRETLTNLTDGGDIGPTGYRHTPQRLLELRAYSPSEQTRRKISRSIRGINHPNFDSTEVTLVHPNHGTVKGTKYYFHSVYSLNQNHITRLMRGDYRSHKGWHVEGVDPTRRLTEMTKKRILDALKGNKYCLGNVLSETHRENISKATKGTPLSPSVRNKRFGNGNPNYKSENLTMVHDMHGTVTATRQEFIVKYAIGKACLSAVIKGRQKSARGWRLPS